MNPIAKPKPATNSNPNNYTGNAHLTEARFLELLSSIRALYRSVRELRNYLLENPTDGDSLLLLQAICEDKRVLRKQRAELLAVVEGLRQLGKAVDVPDDVRGAMVSLLLDEDDDDGNDVAIGINNRNINSNGEQQQSNDNDNNIDNDNNDGPGFHL